MYEKPKDIKERSITDFKPGMTVECIQPKVKLFGRKGTVVSVIGKEVRVNYNLEEEDRNVRVYIAGVNLYLIAPVPEVDRR